MKKITVLSFVIFSVVAFAQEVKLKGDFVYVNGNKCLQFKSKNLGQNNTFSSLDGKKLFYIDAQDNKVEQYYKIQFMGAEEMVTLQENSISPRKEFIVNLIEEGVLNQKNCSVNLANLKNFKERYHKEFRSPDTTVIINETNNSTPRTGINIGVGIRR